MGLCGVFGERKTASAGVNQPSDIVRCFGWHFYLQIDLFSRGGDLGLPGPCCTIRTTLRIISPFTTMLGLRCRLLGSVRPVRAMPYFKLSRLPYLTSSEEKRAPEKKIHTRPKNTTLPEDGPKIRYLVLMILLSFGALHVVASQVDKKAPPKRDFTEREFEQYEKDTGLKRRHKLVSFEKNDQYAFYAVPHVPGANAIEKLAKLLPANRELKVIDPAELITKEVEEERKYAFLLQEIQAQGRSMPRGLVTALVKEEVQLYMNTTRGQNDTNIVLVNYPKSTEEAIEFENDIADVRACVTFSAHPVEAAGSNEESRRIANVMGYFDTVDKVVDADKVKEI